MKKIKSILLALSCILPFVSTSGNCQSSADALIVQNLYTPEKSLAQISAELSSAGGLNAWIQKNVVFSDPDFSPFTSEDVFVVEQRQWRYCFEYTAHPEWEKFYNKKYLVRIEIISPDRAASNCFVATVFGIPSRANDWTHVNYYATLLDSSIFSFYETRTPSDTWDLPDGSTHISAFASSKDYGGWSIGSVTLYTESNTPVTTKAIKFREPDATAFNHAVAPGAFYNLLGRQLKTVSRCHAIVISPGTKSRMITGMR